MSAKLATGHPSNDEEVAEAVAARDTEAAVPQARARPEHDPGPDQATS